MRVHEPETKCVEDDKCSNQSTNPASRKLFTAKRVYLAHLVSLGCLQVVYLKVDT